MNTIPFSGMEPDTWGDTDAEHVQCSIAISLKRIADSVEVLATPQSVREAMQANAEYARGVAA